jgi:hypothetical protein
MSDERSDDSHVWWMPPGQHDPAEHEEPIEQGGPRAARSIGPISLRSSRRPSVLAGVAVVALLGGGAAALAVTNSSAPSASIPSAVAAAPAPGPAARGPGGHAMFGHFGGGPRFGGPSALQHGQFTLAKPGGGYVTVDVQSGDVTAVSSLSITLKSSDGFTHSYAIVASTVVDAQRDGIASVKVGNQAFVLATVSGGTATAANIRDLTLLQQSHQAFGFGQGGSRAQPG